MLTRFLPSVACVVTPCRIMPATAHIARRPFLISLSAISSVTLKPSGLKRKSPGTRSPDSRPLVTATPVTASMMEMKTSDETTAFGCASHASQNTSICDRPSAAGKPGSGPTASTQSTPAAASMAMRPCLISASRIQYKSMPRSSISERPSGSKPTSPARVPSSVLGCSKNGRAGDLAPTDATARGAGAATNAAAGAAKHRAASTSFIAMIARDKAQAQV
mmetsp:Transcript_3572/g.12522  ORF Transcript_3572/g.12522 Transcript_3572/m.12522 type:complete len:220 (+) Transcript_3572:140-799(+)